MLDHIFETSPRKAYLKYKLENEFSFISYNQFIKKYKSNVKDYDNMPISRFIGIDTLKDKHPLVYKSILGADHASRYSEVQRTSERRVNTNFSLKKKN